MISALQQGSFRRFRILAATTAVLGSLLVVAVPAPVSAGGGGNQPAPGGQRTGEDVFSFVADDNSCESMYANLEVPVEVSSWGGSSWSRNTPVGFPANELLSVLGTPIVYTGTVRDTANQPVPNAIVGTLMLSNLPAPDAPSPEVVAATCAVTNAAGQFSVRALNVAVNFATPAPTSVKLATLGVSPPLTSATLETPGLGSTSVRLTPASPAIVNVNLQNANVNWGSYVFDQRLGYDDFVTFPTSTYCVQDPTPTTGFTVCGISRGKGVSAQVTHFDVVSYDLPIDNSGTTSFLRLYLGSDVDLPFTFSFDVSGFTGPRAVANGRWTNAMSSDVLRMIAAFVDEQSPGAGAALLEGSAPGDVFVDVPVESGSSLDAPLVGKTSVSGVTFQTQIWRNTLTVPTTSAGRIAITAYHRHFLGSPSTGGVVSSFRYVPIESDNSPNGRTAYQKLTGGAFEDGLADTDFFTTEYQGGGGGGGGCGDAGTGNLAGMVVTSLDPVTAFADCGYLDANPYSDTAWGGGPGWEWENGALASPVDASGHFGFDVPATGVYRLQFRPNFSTEIPVTYLVARFTVSEGSPASMETCANFSLANDRKAADERCTSGWVTASPSDGRFLFQVLPGNLFGQALTPDGQPLNEQNSANVYTERIVNFGGNWGFNGDGTGGNTGTDGKFILRLSDGRYRLIVESPQGESYAALRAYLRVSGGGTTVERCTTFDDQAADEASTLSGCTTLSGLSWETPLQLQFTSGDLTGRVSGASYFWVEQQKKSNQCPTCYQQVPGGNANANDAGTFSLNFDEAGTYKLFLNPPKDDTTGATRSEVLVEVTIDGGTKTLVVTQNGSTITPVDGIYDFTFNTANFVVLVTDPNGTALSNSWVSVQKLEQEQQGENFNFNVWVDSARSGLDGKARMSLTAGGYYKLVASNPTSDPYPELAAYIRVIPGDTPTFRACSSFQNRPVADRNGDSNVDINDALVCGSQLNVSNGNPFPMTFQGADFRGQVTGSGNFWVEISRLNTTQCEECFDWVGGTVANQNGIFGVNFDSAGTYKLSINPPWNDTSGATRTEVTVVVSGTSPDFDYVVTRGTTVVQPTDGTYLFSLSTANFAAVVRNGGSAEPYPNASFERWNTEYLQFQWSSVWANGNASGQFSASLTDGLWRVTARPGFQSEGTATPAVVYVVIENGEVSAAGVATSQACAQSALLPSCTRLETAVSGGVSRYIMPLGTPNFSGYVTVASDTDRDGSGVPTLLSNAVAYSWMEVQAWNVFEQQYRWSPDVPGINTSANGRFASTLPAGNAVSNPDSKYLVTVNARPQDAAAGRSRGSFRVRVVDGAVLCDANYAFCDAGQAPAPGRFDLSLSGANLTGEVRTGAFPSEGMAVVFGQVRAERWNGQWFEWSNLWAQTGSNGRFAMNLESAGTYKITSEAPSWNNAYAGFANVSSYVKFDGTNVCEVTDQNDESCNDTASPTIDLEVVLVGANVRGTVESAAGVVRNSWINVQRYNTVLGWWEWVTGAPVNSSGAFSLSLAPSADGDKNAGGTQQRFKLEIMPPWGSSTLTRKEVQLWVGDVGQSSGSNYYRICDEASMGACTGNAAEPLSGNADPADVLEVMLTAGNLGGTVTTDGVTGMANAWINVEKWTTPSWAREPMWQWVEVFANANQVGAYNMDLEPQGAGHYRITANPGWNNPDNLTRTSVVVYQNADGHVCRVDGPGDSDCDDAANPYSLDIQLAGANLVGTLKNGSDNVAFAWVGLMRERNNAGFAEDAPRTNTWYEWLGGSNTSAAGSFGMRIEEDGRYQLEVNPPWNTTLTRFSVYLLAEDSDDDGVTIEAGEIRICTSKSESNDDCRDNEVWSSGSNSQISFPTANVAIRVCDKDDSGVTCTGVPNAWVNVFSGYEWIGGANTNNLGVARFSLPDGENYRFEANPNWANPDGSRVETGGGIKVLAGVLDLDAVTGAAVINTSAGQIDIRLGSPNVTGTVYFTNASNVQTAMPWAYVGVRQNLGGNAYNWLPGASVDGTGTYRLALADGDYTLTAYPNPSVADRAPVSITASVVGGVATCTGAAEGCDIDFDGVEPNVVFTLTNVGTFTRALYVYDSADDLVMSVSKAPSGGSVAMRFFLADGTYTLRVQALNTVATDGSTPIVDFNENGSTCRTFELEVAGGVVANQAALNLWAGGFNGNDETTGLECA